MAATSAAAVFLPPSDKPMASVTSSSSDKPTISVPETLENQNPTAAVFSPPSDKPTASVTSSSSDKPTVSVPETLENQNPNPNEQSTDPSSITIEIENQETKQEEEEEEESGCGFCLFMKGGECRETFINWENCVEEGEKNDEDIVNKCFEVTSALKKCMEAHSDYYGVILQAEKDAEQEVINHLDQLKEELVADDLNSSDQKQEQE